MTVKGSGPQDASIMLVCDYPTKDELTSKKVGTGGCGRLISNYFHDNGYDFSKVYKTVLIKDEFSAPKALRAKREAINDLPMSQYESTLREEIREICPNVIISAGELSTLSLTGRKPVTKLRGSILRISEKFIREAFVRPSLRIVPVIHPRDILGNWIHNAYTSLDYAKAIKYKDRTDPHKENTLLWICRTTKELTGWWARARHAEYITVDIETYMTFITCLGMSHDGYEGISVPLVEEEMNPLERGLLVKFLHKIFISGIPIINQNIRYDDRILSQWGFHLKNIAGDTMLLGHCIYPELPKGLDFLTSIYTEMAYYKDDGRDFNPKDGWDTLFYYNAKDAVSTHQIYKKQIEDAKEMKVYDFYTRKVWPLFHIYKKMEDRGIRIDEAEQRILQDKYETILEVRTNYLRKLAGKPSLNFNSPKQMRELIFEELELPKSVGYKTNRETGIKNLSTDEETLEELLLNHVQNPETQELLWSIIWCRKLEKILDYIRIPFHLDGRIRTNVKLAGTKSGRTSNSKTVDRLWFKNNLDSPFYNPRLPKSHIYSSTELGLSFQTIPKHGFEVGTHVIGKDIRRMFVASPGYTFVEGDGGQAEARVVCILSDDTRTLDEMNRKDFEINDRGLRDDLHTKTAMLVLNRGFDTITEDDRQNFGKKPRHAGNYDMGAARLSLMAHISLQDAQVVLTRFHSNVPKVRENFHTRIRSLVSNMRELRTPHGRLRQFFDKLTNETFKEAYSYIPQAVVSDHIKFSTLTPLIYRWDEGAFFLSESHDSLLFEVKNEFVEPFCSDFKSFEETPISFNEGSFISDIPLVIPLELKTGENWYEMKKVEL